MYLKVRIRNFTISKITEIPRIFSTCGHNYQWSIIHVRRLLPKCSVPCISSRLNLACQLSLSVTPVERHFNPPIRSRERGRVSHRALSAMVSLISEQLYGDSQRDFVTLSKQGKYKTICKVAAAAWPCIITTMHFSKTYTQLLLTLPPDLRENAIEYRQVGSRNCNY